MSKWKCEICGSDFDNFHAQGFDEKIYCPLCFFKKLSSDLQVENYKLKDKSEKQRKEYQETYKDVREEIKDLKTKNNDLQQRIDETIEFIQNGRDGKGQSYVDFVRYVSIDDDKKILDILQGKEVK